jgi:hypothetical protein
MYLEIMKDAADKGYRWFDMNPSGGNAGAMEFKEHFGLKRMTSRVMVRRKGLLGVIRHIRQFR